MQKIVVAPEEVRIIPDGPIRTYYDLHESADLDGMIDFVADFLRQDVISLPHPDHPDITTYARCSQHFDMHNEVFFSDEKNENQWCLVQYLNFFQFAITEKRFLNFFGEPAGFVLPLREQFAANCGVPGYLAVPRKYAGGIIGSSRPFHFFYDQFMYLNCLSKKLPNFPRALAKAENVFYKPSVVADWSMKDPVPGEFYIMPAVCSANYIRSEKPERFFELAERFERTLAASVDANTTLKLWFGISVEKRGWLEQIEGYTNIALEMKKHFNEIEIFLDGLTAPFGDTTKHEEDVKVAEEIEKRLSGCCTVIRLIGVDYQRKIERAFQADAFIADAGSGSFVPFRICRKGGVMIGNGHIFAFFGAQIPENVKIVRNDEITGVPGKYKDDAGWMNFSINWRVVYNYLVDSLSERYAIPKLTIVTPENCSI